MCANCNYGNGFRENIHYMDIPKKVTTEDYLLCKECPNCGCQTLYS